MKKLTLGSTNKLTDAQYNHATHIVLYQLFYNKIVFKQYVDRSRLLGASISHISPWRQPFPTKNYFQKQLSRNFSRLLSNIQSEQSYDHTSHAKSQKRDLNCCQQWRQPAWKSYLMIVLIFYRVKNTRLKPNNKMKKVIHYMRRLQVYL